MTGHKNRYPPGPFALTELRHYAGGSYADTADHLLACARRYGPIWSFRFFNKRIYVLNDADAIRTVLVDKQHLFAKNRRKRLKPIMGEGLLLSDGPLHVRQRRIMQPAFHRVRIANYADVIVAEVLRAIAGWRDDVAINLGADMLQLTLRIVGATLFGTNVTSETQNVRDAAEELTAVFPQQLALWSRLANLVRPSRKRRFLSIGERLNASVARIIASRQADSGGGDDLLAMLLNAHDEDGNRMPAQQVRDEAITILLAGHETTAIALTWALAIIAYNASVRERIESEIAAVVRDDTPRFEHVADLRYTAAVFEEVLRLYPPVWVFGRRVMADVDLLGYRIPRGSVVTMSPYVTHRNPRYYSDPLAFAPDRWLEGEKPPKFAFFPFSAGAYACIGEGLARLEGTLALATIIARVRLIPKDSTLPNVAPQMTLRPARPIVMKPMHRDVPEPQLAAGHDAR